MASGPDEGMSVCMQAVFWASALISFPNRCPWDWNYGLCSFRMALTAATSLFHLAVWFATYLKHQEYVVYDHLKARIWVVNLMAAMMYVILQKEVGEVPGGSHAAGLIFQSPIPPISQHKCNIIGLHMWHPLLVGLPCTCLKYDA